MARRWICNALGETGDCAVQGQGRGSVLSRKGTAIVLIGSCNRHVVPVFLQVALANTPPIEKTGYWAKKLVSE